MSLEPELQASRKEQSFPAESFSKDAVEVLSNIAYPTADDFLRAFSEPISAEEFLRRGPQQPAIARGWPGTLWDREMIYDEHPTYRAPQIRPTAEEVLTDLKALAGTDRPSREYPDDFFSREVIYGG
jgi:hypothetical protein